MVSSKTELNRREFVAMIPSAAAPAGALSAAQAGASKAGRTEQSPDQPSAWLSPAIIERIVRRQAVVYRQPAVRVRDYLCLGNGDIGIQIDPFGSQAAGGMTAKCDLWLETHGTPDDPIRRFRTLKEFQEAFANGGDAAINRLAEEEHLVSDHWILVNMRPRCAPRVVSELSVDGEAFEDASQVLKGYNQTLDIFDAICTTNFSWPGRSVTRGEAFLHSGRNAIVLRLRDRAEPGKKVSRTIKLARHLWDLSMYSHWNRMYPDLKVDPTGKESFAIRGDPERQLIVWEYENAGGLKAAMACKVAGRATRLVIDHDRDPGQAHDWPSQWPQPWPHPTPVVEGNASFRAGPAPELDLTIVASLVTSKDDPDPTEAAIALVTQAAETEFPRLREQHTRWWHDFWAKSFLELDDKDVENYWYMQSYFLASSSRGRFTPPLCQLWPSGQPEWPWQGHYFDFNHATMHLSAQAINHPELADPYWRLIQNGLPGFRANANQLYGARGIAMPHCYGPDGYEISMGPHRFQYYHTALVGCLQYWRYLYDPDRELLRREIYPFLREAAQYYRDLLEWDDQRRCWSFPLPACTINEDLGAGAMRQKNDAFDLACLHRLLKSVIEASETLDLDQQERRDWQSLLDQLAPFPRDERTLLVNEANHGRLVMDQLGVAYPTLALGRTDPWNLRTLAVPVLYGMGGQCFTGQMWAASAAWLGQGDTAIRALHSQWQRHLFPNGQVGESTVSFIPEYGRAYPDVLINESGSYSQAAVTEMLCQSLYDGVIRVFPAVPERLVSWRARFAGLRTSGGFEVSSELGSVRDTGAVGVRFIGVKSLAGNDCRVSLQSVNDRMRGDRKRFWTAESIALERVDPLTAQRIDTITDARVEDGVLRFPTRQGSTYLLCQRERRPDQLWLQIWDKPVTPTLKYVGLPPRKT